MNCSSCGSENFDGARFCDACGTALPQGCPSCGASNRTGARFCNACGTALGQAVKGAKAGQFAAPAVSGPTIGVSASVEAEDVPEGERKLVTALFADIKG